MDILFLGIYINSSSNGIGLFYQNYGTIKNVSIENSYIKGKQNVASIVADNRGTIEKCYNTGEVVGTSSYVGGIAGANQGGTVNECYNRGKIIGKGYLGGIVGYSSIGEIYNCYNNGDIEGSGVFVGGIVGRIDNGTAENCYNKADISNTNYHTGGITGCVFSDAELKNCYNTGKNTGLGVVGGICGQQKGTIRDCYYLLNSAEALYGSNAGTVIESSSKTETEMKSQAFVTTLNTLTTTTTNTDAETGEEITTTSTTTQNVWVFDAKKINDGYPILSWQAK